MDNWAVVIGVDRYPASAGWTLNGAVRDALAMRQWLLRPDGGGVAQQNLTLLLSPREDFDPGVPFTPATHNDIEQSIGAMLKRSQATGERMFFYFAGHGLSLEVDLTVQQGILARDFSDDTSTRSFTVKSLFDLFLGTRFKEQYFIIDACRNIKAGSRIRLGDYSNCPPAIIPPSPQFVMFATQPGGKSVEVGCPGDESGAFTTALLKGLKGEGAAKTWDDDSGQYVVRWNELFADVVQDVRARKLRVGLGTDKPLIQEPRQYGERGDQNPELARFADGAIPDVELRVFLAPTPSVLSVAKISINALAGLVREVNPPISDSPVVAPLRPRTYGVNGVARGFRPASTKTVKLYAPGTVQLEFAPEPPPSTPPAPPPLGPAGPAGPGPLATISAISRGIEAGGPSSGAAPAEGGLDVSASDGLSLVQIANEAGTVIASGRGGVGLSNLPYGFYSARLISPEGEVVNEVIASPSSHGASVHLTVPQPRSAAMDELIERAGFGESADGAVLASESIGPALFVKTSTILALAAAAKLEDPNGPGAKLRHLQFHSFRDVVGHEAAQGVQFMFGDERNEGFWESVHVTCGAEGGEAKMHDAGDAGSLFRSFVAGTDAGAASLRIRWDEHVARIDSRVLPNRLTLVVVTREADGSIELHQYMPLIDPTQDAHSGHRGRDPQFGGSAFAAIRRTEYMQRMAALGRVSASKPDVELLLYDKWIDPIAGCLGAYLALRMGFGTESATSNLVKYFGELPDSHILRGAWLVRQRKADAAGAAYAFREAVRLGLPVFSEGVKLLREHADSLKLEKNVLEKIAEMASRTDPAQQWSIRMSEIPVPA